MRSSSIWSPGRKTTHDSGTNSFVLGQWLELHRRGLAKWMDIHDMDHVRGATYHPMTQGKTERWHQTLKNRILLEHYYLRGDLKGHIDSFVEHCNHRRYYQSLSNLTPADVYFGRGETIEGDDRQ